MAPDGRAEPDVDASLTARGAGVHGPTTAVIDFRVMDRSVRAPFLHTEVDQLPQQGGDHRALGRAVGGEVAVVAREPAADVGVAAGGGGVGAQQVAQPAAVVGPGIVGTQQRDLDGGGARADRRDGPSAPRCRRGRRTPAPRGRSGAPRRRDRRRRRGGRAGRPRAGRGRRWHRRARSRAGPAGRRGARPSGGPRRARTGSGATRATRSGRGQVAEARCRSRSRPSSLTRRRAPACRPARPSAAGSPRAGSAR